MLPTLARTYLLAGLEGTPAVLAGLLGGLAQDDARWDVRPDPDRYTLREIVAHLATVEPYWPERARRTREEEEPFFPRAPLESDEVLARPPAVNLAHFAASRAQFVQVLRELDESDWERVGRSEFLGTLTLENQAVFVCAHDGYHLKQIAQWLAMV